MKKKKLPRMVKVVWIDSCSISTAVWGAVGIAIEGGQKGTLDPCISIGFVLKHTKACLVLAPHLASADVDDDTQCSGDMTIPCRAISSIKTLK